MYYSDELVAEVRSRSDIVDVIGSYISLNKKGANYEGVCPFHNDHSPSMKVSRSKQIYKCFACGEAGNVFSFVMKYENLTFPEAVKVLADRTGVQLPEISLTGEEKRKADKKIRILEVNKEAATYFYKCLRSSHGTKGMEYFTGRGLTEETMKQFGLGYAGINGRDVVDYLRSRGFSDEEIKEARLASASEKSGLVTPFWNRVMFPLMDVNHRVIGFGGRVLGDAKPKYLNSPESPVFDKKRNLYGFVFARNSRSGYYILCEGYMDVIAMHQAGFNQAVASLGTAFTEEQARMLSRYTTRVYLAYDSDGPGVSAALRALEILKRAGISGKVIDMRPYKDPDEFIKGLGKEEFQKRIDNAENGFFFKVRVDHDGLDQNDPEQRTQFYKRIAENLFNDFKEPLERENYLIAVCDRYGIDPAGMREMVINLAAKGEMNVYRAPRSLKSEKAAPEDGIKNAQAMILTWLTDEPGLLGRVRKYIGPKDFTEGIYRRAAEMVFSGIENDNLDLAAVIDLFGEEEQNEVAGMFQAKLPDTASPEERRRAFSDMIIKVRENSYNRFCENNANDMSKLKESIALKKELEALKRTGASPD